MMPYLTSYYGGTFTDNEDNPSIVIDMTTLERGVSVEGTVYPYRKYAQDGTEHCDFSNFDYTMNRNDLIAYRDMLTEIINKTR